MNDQFIINVNGTSYDGFTQAEVYKSIETASGEFSFAASNTLRQDFPFKKGDSVEVYIGTSKIITGYINALGGNYNADSHMLEFSGRDKTQDLIDSSIKGDLDLASPISLVDIIKQILNLNGLSEINVINRETLDDFSKSEIAIAEEGENAFSFIEKYCQKRQVLFTTDEDGDIVLTRAGSEKYNTILKNNNGAMDNNIVSASFSDSDAERFYEYIVKTQGNVLDGLIDKNRQSKSGSANDTSIRNTRILVINSNLSTNIQTNTARAIWESNIRRTRGFLYRCRVKGYHLDDAQKELIRPNKLVTVSDDLFGIRKDCLIKSCRYFISPSDSYTDIDLVNQDAYTLQASQDAIEAKFNKSDDILAGLGL